MDEKRSINRIGMFDLVKGILMVLIILGHSITDYFHYWEYENTLLIPKLANSLPAILTYGLIPMFFMICGYGFRKKSMKKAVVGQFKYFWKPYLLVTAATALIVIIKKILINGSIAEGLSYQVLPYFLVFCPGQREFLGLYMDSVGPIWFFWVFVTAGILLNLILQEEQSWVQFCLVIILSCAGLMMRNITLPWCIQQTLVCCGYMYIGWFMKKQKMLEQKLPSYLVLLVILLCLIASLNGGNLEISQNVYANGAEDLLISYLAGIISMFGAVKIGYLEGSAADKLCWIGKNALYICCIHTVTYTVVPWERLAEYFDSANLLGMFVEIILQFGVAVGGCFLLNQYQMRKREKASRRK